MTTKRWSNITKIVVVATVALLAILLLVAFRVMIAPTIVAFLLAFILSYPVNWVQRRTGFARSTTVALLYVLMGVIVVAAPTLFYPRIVGLFSALQRALQDLVSTLQSATAGPLLELGTYRLSLDTILQQIGDALQNVLVTSSGNPVSMVRNVTNSVLIVIYVLVVNFWLLKDLQKLQRFLIEQIPSDYQAEARMLGHELGQIWSAFLRGQIVLAIVIGAVTWISLVIVGMPNAGGLALLAGIMEFLPNVGPGISGAIGTLLALFQGSNWSFFNNNVVFALIVLIIYAIINQVESIYFIPRLVGGRVKLHPAVTFVVTIAGALVFGILGVLIATPVVASARTILTYIRRKLLDLEPFEAKESAEAGIRIRGLIAGRPIEGIVFDLDGTLTQLDWSAVGWLANRLHWLERLVPEEQRKSAARRLMIALEGVVNFSIDRLRRLDLLKDQERLQPLFDRIRGYPPADQLQLQPDIDNVLRHLRTSYRLGLVTTRERAPVEGFLASAGLSDHLFDVVLTQEDVRSLTPHSETLIKVAQCLQIDPNHLLVVSDSDINLRSGAAAEMATAGVLSGLGRAQDLQAADLILNSPTDLPEWL